MKRNIMPTPTEWKTLINIKKSKLLEEIPEKSCVPTNEKGGTAKKEEPVVSDADHCKTSEPAEVGISAWTKNGHHIDWTDCPLEEESTVWSPLDVCSRTESVSHVHGHTWEKFHGRYPVADKNILKLWPKTDHLKATLHHIELEVPESGLIMTE